MKPTMNASRILSTGALRAALLAITTVAAPATQQANPAPSPVYPQTATTPPATQGVTPTGIATWSSGQSPVLVDTSGVLNGRTVTAIASSGGDIPHWLALCSDGNVAAWGDNTKGQLGIGNRVARPSSATPVLAIQPVGPNGAAAAFTAVAAYGNYSMALTSDGKAYVWGTDDTGDGKSPFPKVEHDGGTSFVCDIPRPVSGLNGEKIAAIAAGSDPLFLSTDGSLYKWGGFHSAAFNPNVQKLGGGELPYGDLVHKTITAIAGGRYHFLALCSDGTFAFAGFIGDDLPNKGPLFKYEMDCTPPNPFGATFPPRPLDEVIVQRRYPLRMHTVPEQGPKAFNSMGVLLGKTITAISAGGGNNCLAALCSDGTLVTWRTARWPDVPPNSLIWPSSDSTLHAAAETGRTLYDMVVTVETSTGDLQGKKVTAMGSSADSLAVACSDGTVAEWDAEGKFSMVDTSGVLQGKKILAIAPGVAIFSDQGNDSPSGANDNSANSGAPATPANPSTPANATNADGKANPLGPGGLIGAFKSLNK